MRHPTWLELANMTDAELARAWQEWDSECCRLLPDPDAHGSTTSKQWYAYDEARNVRDQIQRYAGQRLINRLIPTL
jgi:hypothetical protein